MCSQKINIEVYTDGSCHTVHKTGAWAAILFIVNEKVVLNGLEHNTTNQRMEMLAVLNVLEYIIAKAYERSKILIYTDSQYVVGIESRIKKFKQQNYKTNSGKSIRNEDLVRRLVLHIENLNLKFIKVKAHLKTTDSENYNRFVDKLSRKLVRDYVFKNYTV